MPTPTIKKASIEVPIVQPAKKGKKAKSFVALVETLGKESEMDPKQGMK